MTQNNYWVEYWQKDNIVNKANEHEKVGRTIKGKPISEAAWKKTLTEIFNNLNLTKDDRVIDLGAGSGSITFPCSKKVNHIIAVDISEQLLSNIPKNKNLSIIKKDIRDLNFDKESFDKIIFNFAIQHFSDKEVIELSSKLYYWLNEGGLIYIGDIPDRNKLFTFYNNPERKKALINSILNDKPIIGNWFNKQFLKEVFKHAGFKKVIIKKQPSYFINSHYRFDILLTK